MLKLPNEVIEVFERALVSEFSVISPDGKPITHPMLPCYDKEKGLFYFTSSVLFSRKVEYIKKNPKVSVLFSNVRGLRVEPYRTVLVKGDAKIDDSDLHHGWERLLHLWRIKEPYIDQYVKARYAFPLFFERIIIEVSPVKVYFWPKGDTSKRPLVYEVKG